MTQAWPGAAGRRGVGGTAGPGQLLLDWANQVIGYQDANFQNGLKAQDGLKALPIRWRPGEAQDYAAQAGQRPR
ncbi:hypothetical protein KV557_01435 [Kitasatospora aureofaciens]|uniref:hypothetical protein n=1 Tax=Kitasatospora aureofaciens TaxID=1894 RepID=UPI001C473E88|nr:hypothetical protein [Kitasatospora aureofaciens]MBV6695785.1 hypothetical protein [Kitasatospora aureofaciens]